MMVHRVGIERVVERLGQLEQLSLPLLDSTGMEEHRCQCPSSMPINGTHGCSRPRMQLTLDPMLSGQKDRLLLFGCASAKEMSVAIEKVEVSSCESKSTDGKHDSPDCASIGARSPRAIRRSSEEASSLQRTNAHRRGPAPAQSRLARFCSSRWTL